MQLYVKYWLKLAAFVLLFSGNVNAKVTLFENIDDLTRLKTQLEKDDPPKDRTLVIFDIDDTLLESVNFVGSGKWYNWQRGRQVFDAEGKLVEISDEQKFHCMFRTLGTLFEVGSAHLTQKNAVEIFNYSKQYQLMILTARTAKYRAATQRELALKKIELKNKHFSTAKPGYRILFNDKNRTARVSYRNGIVMASGLNKGLVLDKILKKSKQHFDYIYFIDDSWKNLMDMKNHWGNTETNVSLFHYTRVDKSISSAEIAASDNAKKYYDQFLQSAFPDRYNEFKSGQCK